MKKLSFFCLSGSKVNSYPYLCPQKRTPSKIKATKEKKVERKDADEEIHLGNVCAVQ